MSNRTYSVVLNWSDTDREQGTFGCHVRAADPTEAEAKARQEMRASYSDTYRMDADDDIGGSVVELTEGAIWLAPQMENALRGLLARVDEIAARTGWSDRGEREAARQVLAEIDDVV